MRKNWRTGMAAALLILTTLLTSCGRLRVDGDGYVQCKARVLSVTIHEIPGEEGGDAFTQQQLLVQPLEGPYKGLIYETEVTYNTPNNKNLSPYRAGDRILLEMFAHGQGNVGYVSVRTLIHVPRRAGRAAFAE